MRVYGLRRLSVAFVSVLGLACYAWSAARGFAQEPAYVGADARVFTLAGGGALAPRDGRLGTDVRIGVRDGFNLAIAALPDGSVATVDAHQDPIVITFAGRVRRLPMLAPKSRVDVHDLGAEPDGGLLAAGEDRTSGDFVGIYRLTPGAPGWQRVLRPSKQGPNGSVGGLAVLADGGFAISTSGKLWAVARDGTRRLLPTDPKVLIDGADTLAGLPDGSIAMTTPNPYGSLRDQQPDIFVRSSDGTLRRIAEAADSFASTLRLFVAADQDFGLAATPDGNVLRAAGAIDEFPAGGGSLLLAGSVPGLGIGDGGPPASALTSAGSLTPTSDGALAFSDNNALGAANAAINQAAYLADDGTLFTWGDGWGGTAVAPVIRVLVGPDTMRSLAAIASSTFTTLATGTATITSTFAGVATLDIKNAAGHRIARIRRAVPAGDTTMTLARRPPATDLRLSLTIRGANAAVAKAHAAINTRPALTWKRARKLIGVLEIKGNDNGDELGGVFAKLGRCHRVNRNRVDCQEFGVEWGVDTPDISRCINVVSALSRPDGVRVFTFGGAKRCHAITASGR